MRWILFHSLYLIVLGLAWSSGRAFHAPSEPPQIIAPQPPSASLIGPRSASDLTVSTEKIEKIVTVLSKTIEDGDLSRLAILIETDPKALADLLAQHPHPDHDKLLRAVMSAWSLQSPDNAHRWLTLHQDIPSIERAIEGIIPALAVGRPRDAVEWLQQLRDPTILTSMWTTHGLEIYRHDRTLAASQLSKAPLPTSLRAAIESHWEASWGQHMAVIRPRFIGAIQWEPMPTTPEHAVQLYQRLAKLTGIHVLNSQEAADVRKTIRLDSKQITFESHTE